MAIVSTKAILIFAQFVLCYPVTRHIWKKYLEICEEIWHQMGSKRFDHKLKETVRQHFGQTKEYHNLRYTREVCNSKMKAKVGLTWACLNIKKWVKMMAGKPFYFALKSVLIKIPTHFEDSSAEYIKKTNTKMMFVFGFYRGNSLHSLFISRHFLINIPFKNFLATFHLFTKLTVG